MRSGTGSANQAIVLTPAGAAAIAVVRLVGPGVGAFLEAHFSSKPKVGRAVHGELRAKGETIDDPIVALVSDQVADLNLHGGPWIVRRALELCERAGFDVVEQQVLPLLSEAIDGQTVLQREVLAHLPRAVTELGLRTLLAQPEAWESLKRQAREGRISDDPIAAILADRTLERLLSPPRVAIVGAANVGKSTLANRLFAQERSITADVEGTTRDWVGEIANIDGLPVLLVDTPGLRDTDDPIERLAIQRSGAQIERADLVIVVLDAARPLVSQRPLLERFPEALVVANKADAAPPAWDLSMIDAIRTIATDGRGIDAVRLRILQHFGIDPGARDTSPQVWTARQRNLVERARFDLGVLEQM